jgi:hypothetical protein
MIGLIKLENCMTTLFPETESLPKKEKKKPPAVVHKAFSKLEKTLSDSDIQKLLHLDLVYQIVERYSTQSYSLGSPTSPYFFDGQKAPVKHASLVLRMIKNNKVPKVCLIPNSNEQIAHFFETMWQQAFSIACSDEKQVSKILQEKALAFIQVGRQLADAHTTHTSNDPTLFSYTSEPKFSPLFDALWDFGKEYCTFCLERI